MNFFDEQCSNIWTVDETGHKQFLIFFYLHFFDLGNFSPWTETRINFDDEEDINRNMTVHSLILCRTHAKKPSIYYYIEKEFVKLFDCVQTVINTTFGLV